jgi:fucose permease
MYPLAMLHAANILPPWLVTGAAGYIAGLGQAGSALFPFVTGTIASKAGIEILQPLLLGLTGLMTIAWAFVPSAPTTLETHRED